MAVLDPADSTEANVAVTMQSLFSVGIKSAIAASAEANVYTTSSSLGGVGAKTTVVLVDGLIDFTIINPADSYKISDE